MKIILVFAAILCNLTNGYAATKITIIPKKTGLCVACHGPEGNSTNPEWPNIAGQHSSYLIKQLKDFKQATTRNVPIMTSIVASLTNEDIIELSNLQRQSLFNESDFRDSDDTMAFIKWINN